MYNEKTGSRFNTIQNRVPFVESTKLYPWATALCLNFPLFSVSDACEIIKLCQILLEFEIQGAFV